MQKKSPEDFGSHYHFLGFYCKPVVAQLSAFICTFCLLERWSVRVLWNTGFFPVHARIFPSFVLSYFCAESVRQCVTGVKASCWQSALISPISFLVLPHCFYEKHKPGS